MTWQEKAICPGCGCKDFLWRYDVSTCIALQTMVINGTPHLFANGEIVDKNPNITTHYVKCKECGREYEVEE
jgi:hypothetical protein